jgi:hypothetical protein
VLREPVLLTPLVVLVPLEVGLVQGPTHPHWSTLLKIRLQQA